MRIVAVAAPGTLPPDAGRVVDATGKLVIPGGIDPHVHTHWPIPALGGGFTTSAAPEQVSRAALHGGTTTLPPPSRTVPPYETRPASINAGMTYTTRAALLLIASLMANTAHAQLNVRWRSTPTIMVISAEGDPRLSLVDEAVSF